LSADELLFIITNNHKHEILLNFLELGKELYFKGRL